jgi:hypothetical protein
MIDIKIAILSLIVILVIAHRRAQRAEEPSADGSRRFIHVAYILQCVPWSLLSPARLTIAPRAGKPFRLTIQIGVRYFNENMN